ncbi:MAG: hypothetical protein HYT36_01010 [Candidatus Staskawiczbacteria bacterium]|nr:hypothetical protein [Candidatus Staskawiczbacteria bacterium]
MPSLNWEISASERKKQVRQGIFIAGPLIISFVLAYFLSYGRHSDFQTIITGISGIIVIFGVALLVNEIIPRKNRVYSLNDNGLMIAKGKKTKHYFWNDFEYYYNYSARYGKSSSRSFGRSSLADKRNAIIETGKDIEGGMFYLKKKPKNVFSKLYKKFVVIYSIVNNTGEVSGFLSRHLERRKMNSRSDLGMVFYEFK